MIIDNSYFRTKPLFIPQSTNNVPEVGTGQTTDQDNVKALIDEKESEFLLSFLGFEQYTELLSQLTVSGTFIDDPIQKWVDLVDGSGSWKGLRYKIGSYKKSIIAYYVYFYWLGQYSYTATVMGLQKPESANSTGIIPNDAQAKVWDKFLSQYGYTNVYRSNPYFFHNWNGTGIVWTGSNYNSNETSLYEFMSKNSDVYDLSFFSNYSPVNPYNL